MPKFIEVRRCRWCGKEFEPATWTQQYCSTEHFQEHRDSRKRKIRHTSWAPHEGRKRNPPRVVYDAAGRIAQKFCKNCDKEFELEYNSRGLLTSRALCDECRIKSGKHSYVGTGEKPQNLRTCVDCTAWEGAEYGTVTHLDENGRCPACAAWALKRQERARMKAAGYRMTTVGWSRYERRA